MPLCSSGLFSLNGHRIWLLFVSIACNLYFRRQARRACKAHKGRTFGVKHDKKEKPFGVKHGRNVKTYGVKDGDRVNMDKLVP